MCGIAGIFSYRNRSVDRDELTRISHSIRLRGPDDSGEWYSDDNMVGLAHRRLSIIDLSPAGHQPMFSADGGAVIVFNGEIYNYAELRAELVSQGVELRTHSDTEVILAMYQREGAAMLPRLRGMFAFAIWDLRMRRMFLARDPYGIKPLYYSDDGASLRLASQVKAITAGGTVSAEIDVAGTAGFFLTGTIPEPFTLYRSIRALPAGSYLFADEATGAGEPVEYFSIAKVWHDAAQTRMSRADATELFRESVLETVRYHLVADVPVGAFLSSGIDSSTIVGIARQLGATDLRTTTLSFEEFAGTEADEAPLARKTAEKYKTTHTTRVVTREEFDHDLPQILAAMDQPSIDGVNTYFVSKAAAEAGLKVALSGLGGDELFGSYPSFREVPRMVRLLSVPSRIPLLREVLTGIFRLASLQMSPKMRGVARYGGTWAGAYFLRRGLFLPEELPEIMGREEAREGLRQLGLIKMFKRRLSPDPGSAYGRVATFEASLYMRNQLLRDTDWSSMAHSLEVRVPFVDAHLLAKVAPAVMTLGSESKKILATIPAEPLPTEVMNRKKTGFVIPMVWWLGGKRTSEAVSRTWARRVWSTVAAPKLRILYLTTDAFGGHGGIALYNRDLIAALASDPRCGRIDVFPRHSESHDRTPVPGKVVWIKEAAGGKIQYAWRVLRALHGETFDLVICGHINLLSLGWLASRLRQIDLALIIYGVDAWQPPRGRIATALANRPDTIISISQFTLDKFLGWSHAPGRTFMLPNAIHLDWYKAGPKDERLLDRYGLRGKRVVMTLGRMVSSERYKGFDEVLELLPALRNAAGDVVYLACGSGTDQTRLEKKANALGIAQHVVFTGPVAEEEKNAHYGLADAYVMPSRGEGFGFVFLEALASGVPAVGSTLDGSREALLDGELGTIVDPTDSAALLQATLEALTLEHHVPDRLSYYSYDEFVHRSRSLIDTLLEPRRRSARQ